VDAPPPCLRRADGSRRLCRTIRVRQGALLLPLTAGCDASRSTSYCLFQGLHHTCFAPTSPVTRSPELHTRLAALQWLLSSQAFAEDYGRADDRHIVRGSDPWHRDVPSDDASPEQLFEDVQMGFWLSAHPTLQIVRLKQYSAWCDVWKHVGDLRQLLVAHRAPWDQYAWLDRHMERLWASGSHVVIRVQCGGPPCTGCAHSRGQRACVVEVELARTEGQASVGCKQCVCRAYYPESGRIYKSGGRCSQDYWAGEPKLPRDCRGATSEGPS
jgi:hypothetical protein